MRGRSAAHAMVTMQEVVGAARPPLQSCPQWSCGQRSPPNFCPKPSACGAATRFRGAATSRIADIANLELRPEKTTSASLGMALRSCAAACHASRGRRFETKVLVRELSEISVRSTLKWRPSCAEHFLHRNRSLTTSCDTLARRTRRTKVRAAIRAVCVRSWRRRVGGGAALSCAGPQSGCGTQACSCGGEHRGEMRCRFFTAPSSRCRRSCSSLRLETSSRRHRTAV